VLVFGGQYLSISSDLKVNNVKKNNLINGLFATLLIASPLAGADQKYPAADFQPEVIFQDNDYIAKNNPSAKSSVLSAKSIPSSPEVDSKYPAANFQPQVIYSDSSYKHNVSASSQISGVVKERKESLEKTVTEITDVAVSEKAESNSNYLVGLIALGLVGAFLLKDKFKCPAKKTETKPSPVQSSKSGTTGVGRYLNRASGTGVSRYLNKQVKSASSATGVARYVAKQVLAAKSTAAEAATGVEKYMRNRG
jgi:hypothetical protein